MTTPRATPETIRAARERLAAAREALGARSQADTLESLSALLDEFARPGSAARSRLETDLPKATGFHATTVAAGLDLALAKFTGKALRELVLSEHNAAPGAQFEGFAQTSVLLAGAIPMPTLTAFLFPLVLHSPVLAKTAARDPVTARIFAEVLARIDPVLARCIEIVSFPRDDESCMETFLTAECVVATGADGTIRAVSAEVPPTTRFVGYGHRLSVALLGPAALSGSALADAARKLARDVALWDQQGCLSPVAVFCEGSAREARALGEALGQALDALGGEWPRGEIGAEDAAAVRHARDEALMRRAAGRDVAVFADEALQFTVVVEDELRFRAAPLHRFVRIHASRERTTLLHSLEAVARHLAAVALAGFGQDSVAVARALGALGASRVCAPGEMQAPPLGWHHDGQLLLAPLARMVDVEFDT